LSKRKSRPTSVERKAPMRVPYSTIGKPTKTSL